MNYNTVLPVSRHRWTCPP